MLLCKLLVCFSLFGWFFRFFRFALRRHLVIEKHPDSRGIVILKLPVSGSPEKGEKKAEGYHNTDDDQDE
jgi:hypothetical protein